MVRKVSMSFMPLGGLPGSGLTRMPVYISVELEPISGDNGMTRITKLRCSSDPGSACEKMSLGKYKYYRRKM